MNKTKPRIRIGTSDFRTLIINSDIFVDKSLLVKEFLEDAGEVILISRPRRWGKSLNMNMIGVFLRTEVDNRGNILPGDKRVNSKLFLGGEIDLGDGDIQQLQPLKIAKEQKIINKYLGKYPVISIDFKNTKGSSYEDILNKIKSELNQSFKKHEYLINSDKLTESDISIFRKYSDVVEYKNLDTSEICQGLHFLSELLYKHFDQKVFILVDEYDAVINSCYHDFNNKEKEAEFKKILDLFRGMFGVALKSNDYLEKALITGILRIAKANLFSDLNNIREYNLLSEEFAEYYGFTQLEVDELLKQIPFSIDKEEIKYWYNGYTFGNQIIYNPWSIMGCLASKSKLDYYWLDSGGTGLIDKALVSDETQSDIQTLLEGKSITKEIYTQVSLDQIEKDENALYSLLLFAGYLNAKLVDIGTQEYSLSVPNKEVSYIYEQRIKQWASKKLNINISEYNNFVGLLIDGRIDEFGSRLSEYLLNSTSYHDVIKERDYHNLMGGILAPLSRKYFIESNKEYGTGRADHVLISKQGDTAFIIEYKLSKNRDDLQNEAVAGLEQIDNRGYGITIKQHLNIKKIIKIAICFAGKEIKMKYKVDEA